MKKTLAAALIALGIFAALPATSASAMLKEPGEDGAQLIDGYSFVVPATGFVSGYAADRSMTVRSVVL